MDEGGSKYGGGSKKMEEGVKMSKGLKLEGVNMKGGGSKCG